MARNIRFRLMDNNLAALHTPITLPTENVLKPFTNCFKSSRSEVWESTGLNEVIIYDFTYQAQIGFFGVIGPHDENFGLSLAATITVEANNVNDWVSPPFTQTISVTDNGALAFLDSDSTLPSYRFWRITFSDPTSPNPTISIGSMYLGDYTTLSQRNIQSGFNQSIVDPTTRLESENGSLYSNIKTKYLQYSGLSIGFLNPIDKSNLEDIFSEFGIHTPLFISLDPTLKVSSDLHEMTRYMVFTSTPSFNHIKESIYTMQLDLREFI